MVAMCCSVAGLITGMRDSFERSMELGTNEGW